MNLHEALMLDDARTDRVDLIPTEKFFKPVLVLKSAITAQHAALLGCEYLFDQHGNPHQFDGSHKLNGELAAPQLQLISKSAEMTIKAEKACKMSLAVEEENVMILTIRVHLEENEKKLMELLHFLSKMNKDPFEVIFADAQRSLNELLEQSDGKRVDMSGAPPTDPGIEKSRIHPIDNPQRGDFPAQTIDGSYAINLATKHPFKKGKLDLALFVLEVGPDLWTETWSASWKKRQVVEPDLRGKPTENYASTSEQAAAKAAWAAHEWLTKTCDEASGISEIEAKAAGIAWLHSRMPLIGKRMWGADAADSKELQ